MPRTKEQERVYQKKYYKENKEAIKAKVNAYRKANTKQVAVRKKSYRESHKEEIASYFRNHYKEHRKEKLSSAKTYSTTHKEKVAKYKRGYGLTHKEALKAKMQAYRDTHKEEIITYRTTHKKVNGVVAKRYRQTQRGKEALKRSVLKRKRSLGFNILYPKKDGEVYHHPTNADVIGVPELIHQQLSGHSRKKHRTLVLQWLKDNDKRKYNLALCALAKQPRQIR